MTRRLASTRQVRAGSQSSRPARNTTCKCRTRQHRSRDPELRILRRGLVFCAPGRLAKPLLSVRRNLCLVLLGAWPSLGCLKFTCSWAPGKSRLARAAEDQKLSSACFYSCDPKISQAGSPTSVCVGLLDVHHNSKAVGHISSARPISGCLESEASTLMDQECYEGLSSGTPSL